MCFVCSGGRLGAMRVRGGRGYFSTFSTCAVCHKLLALVTKAQSPRSIISSVRIYQLVRLSMATLKTIIYLSGIK
jgi:hypothetical protein